MLILIISFVILHGLILELHQVCISKFFVAEPEGLYLYVSDFNQHRCVWYVRRIVSEMKERMIQSKS